MTHAVDTDRQSSILRERALTRLRPASRPDLARASTSEAMAVLHQLASSPATAGDALALLHELQVHQVELDLQHEELRHARTELEMALRQQTMLFELAPAGSLTVDAHTVLCDVNPAAARLLGTAREALPGRSLAGFLAAPDQDRLQTLLARAREGQPPEACVLHLVPTAGRDQALEVHAVAAFDAESGRFLLALMVPPPSAVSPARRAPTRP